MKWPFSRSKSRKKGKKVLREQQEQILSASEAAEEMVLIPAGEFQMGTDASEIPGLMERYKRYSAGAFEDETPRRTIYVDAFYMDKYPVTNAQYKKFMGATGHGVPGYWNDPNYNALEHPVVGVSWRDAVAYAEWVGKRLPTEAQWEKAARGELAGKRYPWGNEAPDAGGVYRANYFAGDNGAADGYEYTAPVGSFAPNGYGLYDMAGNVHEWCADWYDSYSSSPKNNPTGPRSGTFRVLRGGALTSNADFLRAANRNLNSPTNPYPYMGFRLVVVSQD